MQGTRWFENVHAENKQWCFEIKEKKTILVGQGSKK